MSAGAVCYFTVNRNGWRIVTFRTVMGYKVTRLQSYKVTGLQGYRVTGLR